MVTAIMSKPHCICFISAKGGSGKTVISASLSQVIAALEQPVTIADCDAATNGLTLLHLPQLNRAKRDADGPLVGMFDDDDEGNGPSRITIAPGLSLVPATFTMASTERVSVSHFTRMLDSLLDALATRSEGNPGYLILDAQAGTDSFAYAAIKRADDVVIVSEYDPVSAEGIERLKIEFGPNLPVGRTWTLFNKLLPEFATDVGDFLKVTGFLPPMPWNANVIRAFARRSLAVDMEKVNSYTLGILAVAKSLQPYDLGDAIDVWKEQKADVIREPVTTKLSALESELEGLERASAKISYEVRQQERKGTLQWLALALTGLSAILAGVISFLITSSKPGIGLYVSLGLAGVALAGVTTTTLWIASRSHESPIELEATRRSLERQIGDLAEERARYQALMIADTDELLSKRLS
jgi:cellulose biosynthesis protein BcsQ